MTQCTMLLLAFTMAMEVTIRASKWVVGSERLQTDTELPPIQAYIDAMAALTTIASCSPSAFEPC